MSENEFKDRGPARTRARREKRTDPTPKSVRPRASRRKTPPPSDRETVLRANALFYRAFELRDLDAMSEVWARVPHVRCIHPGWEPLVGFEEVVGSWGQIFGGIERLHFELDDVSVRVGRDIAWVELSEKLVAGQDGQTSRSTVLATNIFERQPDGRWQMVHHHASPVMVRQPTPRRRGGESIH